ncbi:MAG: hypothetical protein JOZ54_01250 [Acidobacteria bacterium]|nr:hypothetical protein [Acidobacteriota bacterium]
MSLRTFTDSNGQQWEAYDVVPRVEERRRYDRRSGEATVEAIEERRETDRRVTVGRSEHIASKAGWLCFERNDERRRLTPIPEDWTRCDDSKLESYCRSAKPARLTGEHRSIK